MNEGELCGVWRVGLWTLLVSASIAALADDAPPSVTSQPATLLLLDDHEVLYRSGTERVLHPARRLTEKAVISQTLPWEVAIGWTSVHRDQETGKYQLWYQAYAGHRAGDRRLKCVVCYAESDDGLTFTKPELELFPFKEHSRTNIAMRQRCLSPIASCVFVSWWLGVRILADAAASSAGNRAHQVTKPPRNPPPGPNGAGPNGASHILGKEGDGDGWGRERVAFAWGPQRVRLESVAEVRLSLGS